MKNWQKIVFFLIFWIAAASASTAAPPEVLQAVEQIRKTDYEGDRAALKKLSELLAPYADDKNFGSRVRYWRGFALWRRSINGFNEKEIQEKDLEPDLRLAIDEFQKAAAQDPEFVDAKIAAMSCMGYVAYINRENTERVKEFRTQAAPLKEELMKISPDNPRLIWVMGPWLWNTPVEKGGGQDKAIESYQKGLELIRNRKDIPNDPLEPNWGEPELLMNLAWSYSNQTQPDLEAAEKTARDALAIVPYWHYVRDILLPQINDAKAKAQSSDAKPTDR